MALAPRTVPPDEDLDDVEEFLDHIHDHLLACEPTKALAAPFTQLLADLANLRAARRKLARALAGLAARKPFLDDDLDMILDEVKAAFAADKSDEAAALYADKDFFGDESPSAVRRYTLGPQLDKMRLWPGKLAGSPNQALKALGAKTQQSVTAIDPVLTELGTAETALANFDLGPRVAFIDACNAAVKLVFGQLSEMAHSAAKGPLPAGFVDRFFLRDTSGRAPRIQELEKALERGTKRVKRLEEQLKELKNKRAKELKEKEAADLAEMAAKAAAAKKVADEAAAKLAAIQAEIDKKKPNEG